MKHTVRKYLYQGRHLQSGKVSPPNAPRIHGAVVLGTVEKDNSSLADLTLKAYHYITASDLVSRMEKYTK